MRFCNGYHCASEIPMNDESRRVIHNSQTSLLLHGLITSYRTRKLAVATTPTSRQQSTYCRYSDDNVTAGRYFHNARLITPDYGILKDCELECGLMPNMMVALTNIGGAFCSTPQSLADAHTTRCRAVTLPRREIS